MSSYIVIKSITHKLKNEDYIEAFTNNKLGFEGFVLGDGIGSHYLPDEGSKFCVNKTKELLEKAETIEDIDFDSLYCEVYQCLRSKYNNSDTTALQLNKNQSFGTTLICVLEFANKYVVSYLGNGSIWHLRGNFTEFSPQRYLPWNAINLLNPHTVDENGKEALYKFISLESSDFQLKPSVLELKKDNDYFGDILIASTDGLYSNDQNPVAKDREGNLWISGEKKMEQLFKYLKIFTKEGNKEFMDLNNQMDFFLEDIITNKLIDDDTTFGLSISGQALKYHRN